MELVKVKLNEAMAGVNESYGAGEIISFPKDKAARLVAQGTANYFVDSDEVLELNEVIKNLKKENERLNKASKKK